VLVDRPKPKVDWDAVPAGNEETAEADEPTAKKAEPAGEQEEDIPF
jgi:hypothetical protein